MNPNTLSRWKRVLNVVARLLVRAALVIASHPRVVREVIDIARTIEGA